MNKPLTHNAKKAFVKGFKVSGRVFACYECDGMEPSCSVRLSGVTVPKSEVTALLHLVEDYPHKHDPLVTATNLSYFPLLLPEGLAEGRKAVTRGRSGYFDTISKSANAEVWWTALKSAVHIDNEPTNPSTLDDQINEFVEDYRDHLRDDTRDTATAVGRAKQPAELARAKSATVATLRTTRTPHPTTSRLAP